MSVNLWVSIREIQIKAKRILLVIILIPKLTSKLLEDTDLTYYFDILKNFLL